MFGEADWLLPCIEGTFFLKYIFLKCPLSFYVFLSEPFIYYMYKFTNIVCMCACMYCIYLEDYRCQVGQRQIGTMKFLFSSAGELC